MFSTFFPLPWGEGMHERLPICTALICELYTITEQIFSENEQFNSVASYF